MPKSFNLRLPIPRKSKKPYTVPASLVGLFLIFVLPFSIILYLLISEVKVSLNFDSKERLGVEYNLALGKLLEDLESIPEPPPIYPGPEAEYQQKLSAALSRIESVDLVAIDAEDQKLGAELETTEGWLELKPKLLELNSGAGKASPDGVAKAADLTVGLINQIGDTSNLILDPHLDTYYVMDAVVPKLPGMTRSLAQASTLATVLAERKSMTSDDKRRLIMLSELIDTTLNSVRRGLRVAFRSNPALKPQLAAFDQTDNTTRVFLGLLEREFINAADPQNIQTAPKVVHAAGQQALQEQFRLYDTLSSRLDGLLAARIQRSARKKYSAELFGLVMLAVAVYVFYAFARSLRQRFRAVEAMREADARYRSIFNNAAHGIFQMTADGRYLSANPALAKIYGYPSPDDFIAAANQEWDHFYVDPWYHVEFLRQVWELGSVTQFEAQTRRKDGSVIWISKAAHTIADAVGGQPCIEGTIEDITERKEAEKARQEVERMKDEFVSVVSHELRTPLTSIRGALGLLAGGLVPDPEKAQRMLKIAVTNTDRLVRLINNILDLERMGSGRISMEKRSCAVAELMTAAADVMQPAAEKANVKFSLATLDASIFADPDRIIQTLTNLLSNAIKFSPSGGTIGLNAARVDGQIRFEVRDEGRGIPADKLEFIFQRFQQVDASDAREKGGTGLGLAICQTIVTQHHGRIWVESKLGAGSSFYAALAELKTEKTPEKAPAPNPPGTARPGQRILICDDDESVCTVMQIMLEQRGYQVTYALSGKDAVRLATAQLPDVVLLDMMMPEMDGWQTMAALKQNPSTRDIPIVVVSVLSAREKGAAHADVAAWVRKPLDEALLFQALEHAFGPQSAAHTVLLVEDDMALARVVTTMFERHGVKVIHAGTGRQAIEASQKTHPDLVILDIGLPEGDGFSVVNWLRQQDRLRLVPLVVYTARDLESSDRERLKLGVTEFLTKCRVSPEEFEQRVITLLNQIVPGAGHPPRSLPASGAVTP